MFLAYARTVQGVVLGCLQPFAAQALPNSPSPLLFRVSLMPQLTAYGQASLLHHRPRQADRI